MAIEHFTFDRSLTDSFIRFGYDQYKDDARWIPPLKGEIHKQLSPDYPFYKKKGNAHRHFIAICRNKTVGRISAMVDHPGFRPQLFPSLFLRSPGQAFDS